MLSAIANMRRANCECDFRAYRLRGADPLQLEFMARDRAWLRIATLPPHPHAGLSTATCLLVESEPHISNCDLQGNNKPLQPGGLNRLTRVMGGA